MAQQDDYYYEIQLTNKQLIFYFGAGATALILSFLAGVMVGRGVNEKETQATQPAREERIVTEEPHPSPPAAEDLTYAKTLESDKPPESLERPRPLATTKARPAPTRSGTPTPRPAPAAATPAPTSKPPASTTPAPRPTAVVRPTPASATPKPVPIATPRPAPVATVAARPRVIDGVPNIPGNFSIQVGAFKDQGSAESVRDRLKGRGFPAYVLSPKPGDELFNVRVGSFTARADAERMETRLREQEKFKPFIVKQ